MPQSRYIVKIVVPYGNGIPEPHLAALSPASLELSPQATFLVTGGLSGFGLRTAEWLAGRGAPHLVLFSRRGPPTAPAGTAGARPARPRGPGGPPGPGGPRPGGPPRPPGRTARP